MANPAFLPLLLSQSARTWALNATKNILKKQSLRLLNKKQKPIKPRTLDAPPTMSPGNMTADALIKRYVIRKTAEKIKNREADTKSRNKID